MKTTTKTILKTKTIRQTVIFDATPKEIYEMYMDSKKHSKFTGSKAKISRNVGGSFNVYQGSLSGKNVKLIPDKLIVQTWQCIMGDQEWPRNHYSILTLKLSKTKTGTRLSLIQTDVPSACVMDIKNGWKEFYWEPMKKLLIS